MMEAQKQVHSADTVRRAHQLEFLVFCQISQMSRAKFAERDVRSYRLWIFRVILPRLEIRAIWVSRARARHRRLDDCARRGHHARVDAGDRNLIAGFHYRMLRLCQEHGICLFQKVVGSLAWLNVWPMIDELPDRNLG